VNNKGEGLLKVYAKFLSPERCFSSKCSSNRLAARLCPDPLGELTALPQTPVLHVGSRRGEAGERSAKERRKGGEEEMEKIVKKRDIENKEGVLGLKWGRKWRGKEKKVRETQA